MTSPFDAKNRAASALDRLSLRLALLLGCIAYFTVLWHAPRESLLAGSALFVLVLLTLALLEKRTLRRRDRMLRERIIGEIALEDLLLMPGEQAASAVCALLAQALDAQTLRNNALSFAGETWLVRCAQCPGGASASEGDVLAAHRARQEAGLSRCILASTGSFTPAAVRAAEWVDPPVRLIPGPRLAALFGRLHPATDEEIARHARRRRTPFSFARIRALALSPVKLRRYLLCAFLLLLLYLNTGSMLCLASCLLALLLAILCRDESRRSLWL